MEQQHPDLIACADEPIHVPGLVQPHGALLGVDPSWVVTHAGGALDRFFARGWLLGRQLTEVMPAEAFETISNEPLWSTAPGRNRRVSVELIGGEGRTPAVVSLHRNEQGVVIIEAEDENDPGDAASGVDELLAEVVNAQTETATLDAAVRAMRRLTGYQRVVAYVFDQEYNGSVVSESLEPGLTSYLRQHFPASDIPEQARRLYRRKRARLITDVGYRPASVEAMPDAVSPLDLSDAELRSVSPVHVEYLHNMGVSATLVCTLLRDNDLLGMIACHHLSPKHVSPTVRARATVIADVAAARLATLRDSAVSGRMIGAYRENAALLNALTQEPESLHTLGRHVERLQRMIDASGAAVIIGDRVFTSGRAPQERDIRQLATLLTNDGTERVGVTDQLSSIAQDCGHLRDVAAGVLAVSLDDHGRDAVLWFRPEIVGSVNWAGNPYTKLEPDESGVRLSPRKSFESYVELVRDRSAPWQGWEIEVAESVRGSVTNIARQLTQLTTLADERRQAEQAARAHAAELQAASTAMAEARDEAYAASRAKSEFLANMSHEIRTPLTAILGYADVLREQGHAATGCPQGDEAVDTIQRAGQHLLQIINDILDLSKIEAGKVAVERVDTEVIDLVRDVSGLLGERAAAKGVELRTVFETPTPDTVLSDPTRLRQVLMNIVGNAVKFTDRGYVEVRVRATPAAVDAGRRLQFTVEDTGPGLTEEQAESLFRPFEQADNSITRRHGGTGLGLTISRRLTLLMGGDIRLVQTAPGRGSEFLIDLPLVDAASATTVQPDGTVVGGSAAGRTPADVSVSNGHGSMNGAVSVTNAADTNAGGEDRGSSTDAQRPATNDGSSSEAGTIGSKDCLGGRVLLAEDGIDNQRLIALYLTKAGVNDLVVVENGREAIERIDAETAAGRPFDLLITDMQMPEMDGYSLARAVRERGSSMPIVAITAHAMTDDRDKCLAAGCDEYISKPIDREAMVYACRRLMAERPRAGR